MNEMLPQSSFVGGPQKWSADAEGMKRPLKIARHLSGEFYTSPQIAALEKEKIFKRQWLCVGRADEIPNPGDYMTLRVVGEPLVVARVNDGNVVTYMNQCLHRGVEVAFDRGSAKKFNCPYHAWAYDISGKLITAPFMQGSDTDLSHCRLPSFQTRVWRGWIYINFAEDAPSFDEMIAPFEETLTFYRSQECVLKDKVEIDLECNWKFVVENLLDRYHTTFLHKATFGKFLKSSLDDFDFNQMPNGGLYFMSESSPLTADGKRDFPLLPWVTSDAENVAGKASMFPNMNLSMRSDSVRMWVIWPVETGKTRIINYLLFNPEVDQMPDFQEKLDKYKAYIRKIISEDQVAVESMQRVAHSDHFDPGPLSHLEGPIHHVLNNYLKVMGI